MKVIIRLKKRQEAKALPILLRHSSGMVLPERTYVLDPEAVQALRDAGVTYKELSSDVYAPNLSQDRWRSIRTSTSAKQ